MSSTNSLEVTRLLMAWGEGDEAARDQLIPAVFDELRRLARDTRLGRQVALTCCRCQPN